MPVINFTFREGKIRVQIKFPANDALLLRTFDETDQLSAVVDYVKEVSTSDPSYNTVPRIDDLEPLFENLSTSGFNFLVDELYQA